EMPGAGALIHWNRALTPQTESIVVRAMRLDPTQRYQSAAEMRAALEERVAALSPRARLSSSRASQGVVAPRPASSASVVAAKPAVQVSAASAGAICPRCGHKNRAGARFCARDGAPLTPAAVRRVAGSVQSAPATNVIATPGATHALRATEAFAQGRYHQAIQQGQVALTHGHTSADLLLTLARSYEHVGRPLEAADAFDRAAAARPEVATLLAAARAWRASGRLDEAQIDLSKARQIAPDDSEASYLLGLVNLDLGHLAQAEGDLRDTLRLAPDSVPALIAVSRVEEARGQSDEAMATLRQALALDPGSGEAQWRYGHALLERGQFADAARSLEKATQLGVESADVYVALGMAYHATGRRQKARDAVRAALRLAPHHPEAQKLLKSL
ncbi:MAG TPA: tetratricopeptide repeat protein, partial [Ktedonobacterales bacterium]